MEEIYNHIDTFLEIFGKNHENIYQSFDYEISRLYAKYAKDNSMDYTEALQYLTDNEREEFQRDLAYYLEKIRDEEYLKEHRKELQSLSVRARVRRLEMLRANIIRMADGLYNDLTKESTKEYAWDYDKAREKTAISLTDEKHLKKFSAVNSQKIKTLLEFPWNGENYSQKIWNCDDRFVKMLNKNLSLGLVTGQTYSQIIKNIQKECDAQKYQIERLVRTEGTFIANQGSLDTYSQLGVKKYKFVARLDTRTSSQCRELNGKVFNVSDAVAGENLPPLHPYCRSTTIAIKE